MSNHGKSKRNKQHTSALGKKRARIEKEFGDAAERAAYGRERAIMVAKQRAREKAR